MRRASVYRASTKHRVESSVQLTDAQTALQSQGKPAQKQPQGGSSRVETASSKAAMKANRARIIRQSTVAGSVAAKAATELKFLCREIQLLQSLDHPALNKLYEYYISARPAESPCQQHYPKRRAQIGD